MTFAGLAALFLSKAAIAWGLPFPVSILVAALLAVPVGVLVGLPALRVRGTNLAVVTFGLGFAVSAAVFANPKWTGSGLLPGTAPVPSPSMFGFSLDGFFYPGRFAVFALIVFLLAVVGVSNLRRSSTGRKMLAIRGNERAAAAAGVPVSRIKLQAFGFASFVAGLGGALLAAATNEASFSQFTANASITLITLAYIGGIASIAGAAFAGLAAGGGVLYVLLLDHIPGYGTYYMPVSGVLLVLTVLGQPDGVLPLAQQRIAALRTRLGIAAGRTATGR
jgi:ABC-type branched-subunit amino acid transport system permease subunit